MTSRHRRSIRGVTVDDMRTASTASGRLAVLLLTVAVVTLVGCVPDPTDRAPTDDAAGSATASPEPTPAGPTPTPSYVRPTPTPQPTFFVYTVVRGDTLVAIAKRYGTDGRSIAYWNRLAHPSLDPDSDGYRPDYLLAGWTLQLIPNTVVDPEDLPPGPPTPSPDLPEDPGASDVPLGG
jgi:LysM repeat protein